MSELRSGLEIDLATVGKQRRHRTLHQPPKLDLERQRVTFEFEHLKAGQKAGRGRSNHGQCLHKRKKDSDAAEGEEEEKEEKEEKEEEEINKRPRQSDGERERARL